MRSSAKIEESLFCFAYLNLPSKEISYVEINQDTFLRGGGRFTNILSTLIAKEALKIYDNETRNLLQQTSTLENSYTLGSIPPNHASHKHIARLIRNFGKCIKLNLEKAND